MDIKYIWLLGTKLLGIFADGGNIKKGDLSTFMNGITRGIEPKTFLEISMLVGIQYLTTKEQRFTLQ